MLNRLLSAFLLVTVASAVENPDLTDDLNGIKRFIQNGNDGNIGSFHPNKTSISESELNQLEKSLDQLEGSTRGKRDTNNNQQVMMYDEDIPTNLDDELPPNDMRQISDDSANLEVRSTLQDIQLPSKTGSPAFSIHADKVYILYPTNLQDPNIFGRFSMPQSVNLDSAEKTVTQTKAEVRNDPSMATQQQPPPLLNAGASFPLAYHLMGKQYQGADLQSQYRRRGKRQAIGPNEGEEKKRNVETHLNGAIVVLNQDVNEYNQKESY